MYEFILDSLSTENCRLRSLIIKNIDFLSPDSITHLEMRLFLDYMWIKILDLLGCRQNCKKIWSYIRQADYKFDDSIYIALSMRTLGLFFVQLL